MAFGMASRLRISSQSLSTVPGRQADGSKGASRAFEAVLEVKACRACRAVVASRPKSRTTSAKAAQDLKQRSQRS